MANIKSAIKRIKTTEKRTLRNKMVKSEIKTMVKKFDATVLSGNYDEAKVLLNEVAHLIDKAAAKGIVHKNLASRKKSRLTLRLNKVASK